MSHDEIPVPRLSGFRSRAQTGCAWSPRSSTGFVCFRCEIWQRVVRLTHIPRPSGNNASEGFTLHGSHDGASPAVDASSSYWRMRNKGHTQKQRRPPDACVRAAFKRQTWFPRSGSRNCLAHHLLNRCFSAELHRLVTNFFTACPQCHSCDNRSQNDCALHGLLS